MSETGREPVPNVRPKQTIDKLRISAKDCFAAPAPKGSRRANSSRSRAPKFTLGMAGLKGNADVAHGCNRSGDTGAFEKPKKVIHAPPDFTGLTSSVPGLKEELERRWRETQRCIHVEAYTSAVILMDSILEGLLLARAQLSVSQAYQAARAPRDNSGKSVALQDWPLSALIDVAVEIGWLKTDRGKFSHALRESRNVVHPWQAVMLRAAFDEGTCRTTWQVLDASVADLFASLP